MRKFISVCGINCAVCDARIATLNNDDNLRKATAENWKKMYNAPDLDPSLINCLGCRQEGVKFAHCYECEIRNCAKAKNYETCGECSEMETCSIVAFVHQHLPEAISNLKDLN
jgi:hypothetical protein